MTGTPRIKALLLAGAAFTAGACDDPQDGWQPATLDRSFSDVYPVLIMAQEAWGQVALKGMDAIQPIYLPARQITHANPMGQFGYVGANFWKTAIRLNENWMVRLEVAATGL